jgi:hypothetical protein
MPKKKADEKEPVYVFDDEEKKPEESIDDQVERKLVELEQRRKSTEDVHILDIAKNPPEPGYMRVELKKAVVTTRDEDDKEIKVHALGMPLIEKIDDHMPPKDDPTIFVNINGDSVQLYDTIFDVDLKQMAEGQVSDCASTIFPMLMDEYVQLALDEKKARQPEKRKEEFKWWWVIVLIMIIIPIILITIQVLPGLIGGG